MRGGDFAAGMVLVCLLAWVLEARELLPLLPLLLLPSDAMDEIVGDECTGDELVRASATAMVLLRWGEWEWVGD